MAKVLQYPSYFAHRFRRLHRSNYTAGRKGIKPQFVVIHIAEGSYEGSISWGQNAASNVSWHYMIARNGHTTQCVGEQNACWTNSVWWFNLRGVNIEHAGFCSQGGPSEAQLHSSAKITAGICHRYNIPIDRMHIFGHTEIKGVQKPCPCKWPWNRYISLVKQYARKGSAPAPSKPAPSPKPSPGPSLKPRKKIDLERVNICFRGAKDRKTASAFRAALNSVARSRKSKLFARIVGNKAQTRYAATEAWNDSKNDYLRAVIIGRPAVKELDNYMIDALEKNDSTGRVIAANGNGWDHTNEIASWRLAYICDELGFGKSEKDLALSVFKKKLSLKDNPKPNKPKADPEKNVSSKPKPDRGPDRNATAPFIHGGRINYNVWATKPEQVAREVYGRFKPSHGLKTYNAHGYSGYKGDMAKGDSAGIDYYVCPYGAWPDAEAKKRGWEIANYLVRNWKRLGTDTVIYGGKINAINGKGWKDYNPDLYPEWKWAGAKRSTREHWDHVHNQVYRRGHA